MVMWNFCKFNYFPDNNVDRYATLVDNKKFLDFIKLIDYGQYPNLLFAKVSGANINSC